jgi:hypothetical protein
MSEKLKGLPTIYYLNVDSKTERKEYMESQFDKWEISNVTRFSEGIFYPENFKEWESLVYKSEIYKEQDYLKVCINLSTLEMVRHWLENTNEKYLILFEDDYDLNLIEYWHFDWKYLMTHLPYDWDCIQLGFESHNYISFFLHPKTSHSFYGPVLINRHFAQKLIDIHTIKGKYSFIHNYGPEYFYRCLGLDQFFGFVGKTYQIPLITQNPNLDEIPKKHHFICRDLYYNWWKNNRDDFTLKDFFTYGKKYDHLMTVPVVE